MEFQSKRVSQVKSSPSMRVAMRAKQLASEGREIIDLSLGEPDMPPPVHIRDAAIDVLNAETLRYCAPAGLMELRQAIADKFQRENGVAYRADEIVVTNGAKQTLYQALMATLEEGDEVIVPAPYWVSYSDLVTLHGGSNVIIDCDIESEFKLSAAQLEAAITPKTRWLMLNSPSNPTGAVYTKEEFQALGAVLEKYPRILVISDEIYEHIMISDKPFTSFVAANPSLKERTIIVNGVSKAYGMTGWRVGYGAAPKALIDVMSKLQSQSISCVSYLSQKAALAAITGPQDFIATANKAYRERAAFFIDGLSKIRGFKLIMPEGAFYAYPNCAGLIGLKTPSGATINTDEDLAAYLLEEGGVSSVPGVSFGLSPYVRFSFAASLEQLGIALRKLEVAIAALK